MKKLRLGVLGMSEGNGHPYSWSAIFNGYDPIAMANCPFPTIPDYLSKEPYPEQFLSDIAEVTHVWTQDEAISQAIAKAAKIEKVVRHYTDMIDEVDAVLLARDDAEKHYEMALPFLKAGVPIFIDKPLALEVAVAKQLVAAQQYDYQLFTCSSLRYAKELLLSEAENEAIGPMYHVEASIMKYWETYGIHLLEPIVVNLPHRGALQKVTKMESTKIHQVHISWEQATATVKVTGSQVVPLEFTYYGSKGMIRKNFSDSFACFKASLHAFITQIQTQKISIARAETLELTELIERGK
jgi:hypothetical protein